MSTISGILMRLSRLNNSGSGNPNWRLELKDNGAYLTQQDAACSYDMDLGHLGRVVTLELNEFNRVIGYRLGEVVVNDRDLQPDLIERLDVAEMLADPPRVVCACLECDRYFTSTEAFTMHWKQVHR